MTDRLMIFPLTFDGRDGTMAGYDTYLQLERVLQRLTTIDFKDLDDAPGPVYDLADDLESLVDPDAAGELADYLNRRIDDWQESR